jgi:hypothetical protein
MEDKERKNAARDTFWWLAHFPTLRKNISSFDTKEVIFLSQNL